MEEKYKVGTVALMGRPNVGKSTLINNLVGQKVAITSPKPQTTQFPIYAVYDDPHTQIIFIDTPGVFAKAATPHMKSVNREAEKILNEEIDVVLYIIDHTRPRGVEENKVLGTLRKIDKPKILVINKIDKKEPDFRAQYKFLEDEVDEVVEVSAIKGSNLSNLVQAILKYLKPGEKMVERESMPVAALNMSSNTYIEELIREKAFLTLRREVPYKIRVILDSVQEKKDITVIKARIEVPERYKKMIIGAGGQKIKQIGMMARKEFEVSTGRKVFLDLQVTTE
jgi:GTP-binding protein Era